mmetsp:Transcript_80060/g.156545  ORF Transcript_80060/g.156545 Transcript_80060/m.156545 type:complete len:164 (+) Transcript_80060:43-534(+)
MYGKFCCCCTFSTTAFVLETRGGIMATRVHRYEGVYESRHEWRERSPHLSNNVAVCAVRRAHALATSAPPPPHSSSSSLGVGHLPLHGAAEQHAVASACFQRALTLVGRGVRGNGSEDEEVENAEEDTEGKQENATAEAVRANFAKFRQWQEQGGDFQGSLMW